MNPIAPESESVNPGAESVNPRAVCGHTGGGVGLIPGRDRDRWGVGIFHQDFTDQGVLPSLGIDSETGGETGGELFYNIALCYGTNLTFDLQVVDSAIPRVDTAVVLGARLGVGF